ncbi:LuxR family transcriptional regulator [Solihabitans fulvus]|uniref:LuxR family transcriptional regulator n=1 Tax=Solihabitans fulvus TaxID=1892852 RepID=A0A5B2XFW5_9PSEU|nr:helix-turn-helix transcriptional regulator [Solihabitans fulvus]KAA2262014.1 LuxR family transcriptional regulator [Solihabitans fulvus]
MTRAILDATARGLVDEIAADPFAPLRVAVLAPGGHGKTTFLRELGEVYRGAGVPVLESLADAVAAADDDAALLVDDAHLLDDATLDELRGLVDTRRLRIAVACRPWPRPAALTELTAALSRTRPPLLPRPLDHQQTEDFLAARLHLPPGPAVVEFLRGQTGGVPGFLDRVVAALDPSGEPAAHLPPAAIAAFGPDLDRLDPDAQRLLLAVEAGVGLHIDLLGQLLSRDQDAVSDVMQACRATGLLGNDGTLLPIGRRAVAALIPAEQRIGVRQRLAELQLDRGAPVLGLASSLLDSGASGGSVATVFHVAAREALPDEPALSARLFAAAVAAGEPPSAVKVGWAGAAALSGDLDAALRLADQLIAAPDPVDRAAGANVAAAALAHCGQLGRSAELYRWAGTDSARAFAAVGLLGTGHPDSAAKLAETSADDGPPTLLAGAASLMSQGIHDSVTGSATTALSALLRSAALLEPAGRAALLPDSPAALAAVVAVHCGELSIAESVLQRAVAANTGGPLMSVRHLLLLGWIAMVRGNTVAARDFLTSATAKTPTLCPRDWLFATALELGLARRTSDLAALHRTWGAACEAVMRHPVDLFTLLPLGEFVIVAARLRDQDRLAPHLHEALDLVTRLGGAPLWATTLHWAGLHAAIIAEQPDAAAEHARALTACAGHSRYGAVISAAADSWIAVVGGDVDPARVEDAARGLHGVGLWWDGARLAGQAAIRTSDRAAMVSLLDCARLLQGKATGRAAQATPADEHRAARAAAPTDDLAATRLSDREREVAELVLSGLTYKQIGDRLFISAKTVEHHMARMRQRLGCTSRGELLTQLRRLLGATA